MNSVMAFRSKDGLLFSTKEECIEHEYLSEVILAKQDDLIKLHNTFLVKQRTHVHRMVLYPMDQLKDIYGMYKAMKVVFAEKENKDVKCA
jgi:hypothetical protein